MSREPVPQPECGNRLYENEPGCVLPPGHDGWHTDLWSEWRTDEDDNIIESRSAL